MDTVLRELSDSYYRKFLASGHRPKLYSFRVSNTVVKKCKGIARSVVDKEITFKNFKDCLFHNSLDLSENYRTAYSIRSFKHVPFTIKQAKLALSSCDNKRFILADKIHTLAWGHVDIDSSD